jgi:hypothetical protein
MPTVFRLSNGIVRPRGSLRGTNSLRTLQSSGSPSGAPGDHSECEIEAEKDLSRHVVDE